MGLAQDVELPEVVLVGESVDGTPVDLGVAQTSPAASVAEAIGQGNPQSALQSGSRGQTTLTWRGFDDRQVSLDWDGVEWNLPYDGGLDLGRLGTGLLENATLVGGAEPGGAGSASLGGSLVVQGPSVPPIWEGQAHLSGAWPLGGRAAVRAGGPLGAGWGVVGSVDAQGRLALPIPSGAPRTLATAEQGRRSNSDSWNLGNALRLEWDSGRIHRFWGTWNAVRGAYGAPPDLRTLNPRYWRWADWSVDMAVLGHSAQWTPMVRTKVWLFGLWPRNTLKAYDDSGYDSQNSNQAFTSRYEETRLGARGLVSLDLAGEDSGLVPGRLEAKWSVRRDGHQEVYGQRGDPLSEWRLEAALGLKSGHYRGWSWGAALTGFVVMPTGLPGSPPTDGAMAPGAWLMWQTDDFRVKSAFSRRVRFPTLKERFAGQVEYVVANPNLGPEEAWNAEVGALWSPLRAVRLSVDAFGSQVEGLIADEALGAGVLRLGNVDQAVLAGASAAVNVDLLPGLELWAKGAGLYAHRSAQPGFLPYRPVWRGQTGASWLILPGFTVGAVARLEGPQHYQDRYTAQWGELGAYALLDAWVRYSWERWEVWGSARNLTNAWHEPHWGYPGPGLWVSLGVDAQF